MATQRKKLVMCQACRALIDASAKECPLCGRASVPARVWLPAASAGNFISLVILTINILLFVLMAIVGIRSGMGAEAFVKSADIRVLESFGAIVPNRVLAGELWRLVTWNFLHIGLIHMLFNSVALYQIGPLVEELYGSAKFIFIYLAAGILAGAASIVISPTVTAGASGAVFGLIGLAAAYGYRQGGSAGQALMQRMLIWAGIGFVYGVMIGANNVAHAGGFVAGAAFAFLIQPGSARSVSAHHLWNAVMIGCVLLIAASVALAGINFNRAQERADESRNVITLSQRLRGAMQVFHESREALTSKKDPSQIANSLRSAASELSGVPHVDDRSDEIKRNLADALNKRADAFSAAAKAPADTNGMAQAVLAEYAPINGLYEDYLAWEDSVLEKYGLVRTG